jgi:hypothetical protein
MNGLSQKTISRYCPFKWGTTCQSGYFGLGRAKSRDVLMTVHCWNGEGKRILTYGFIINIENKIIYYSNKFVFMYLYDLQ